MFFERDFFYSREEFNLGENFKFEFNSSIFFCFFSHKTPQKRGEFVSLWRRNENGVTIPFSYNSIFHGFIIFLSTKNEYLFLSKEVLIKRKIIISPFSKGELGMRVYAPHDIVESPLAKKSQQWMSECYYLF